ncbi:hypothetical protein BDZ45DRAFT_145557 [Acephala macrosclerotiorum]|nr:hypothetical protein BDZ45DRAFT_145557 [Acephala macrosclerotiorum]
MKSPFFLVAIPALFSSVLAVPSNVIGRNDYPADNCNRDIVGKPAKVADCNSYFVTAVTPVAKTITRLQL